MIKVLMVMARMNTGGTAVYLNNLCSYLPEYGYNVLLATGNVEGAEKEAEIQPNIRHIRVPGLMRRISILNDFRARRALKKLIIEFEPDIIHTHTFKAGFLIRSLSLDIPVIHTFHGHLFDEPALRGWRSIVIEWIEKTLAKRTTRLVTVGTKVGKDLLERGIGSAQQYCSIPPGVARLSLISKEEAAKLLKLDHAHSPVVVWLARLSQVKAPSRVIELASHFPSVLFLVAGGGDLANRIKEAESANLKVLGWQDPALMWSIADIAISTSVNEGIPISLIEAQMSKVPAIAVNVGAVAEVVQSGISGYVVDEFGAEYFSKLGELIKDAELRASFGRAAQDHAESNFSVSAMIKSHDSLYRQVLADRSNTTENGY
jgi:glycosyltransferase involved in cell wall biosynthesis